MVEAIAMTAMVWVSIKPPEGHGGEHEEDARKGEVYGHACLLALSKVFKKSRPAKNKLA